MKKILPLLALIPSVALADGRALTYKDISELSELPNASVADSDYQAVYDSSSGTWKKNRVLGKRLTDVATTAEVNAVHTLVASETSRAIHLSDAAVYASGTVSTATALTLKCSGGSTVISWPAAILTNDNPVNAYASATVTRGTALVDGCPAGEALVASPTGTVATTSEFHFQLIYDKE